MTPDPIKTKPSTGTFIPPLISMMSPTLRSFLWTVFSTPSLMQLLPAVLMLWGTYGMASVIIYTISMDRVRIGREGTDFTLQIVLTHLSGLVIAVGSGKIAQSLGYKGLFQIEVGLSIFVLSIIPFLYKEKES